MTLDIVEVKVGGLRALVHLELREVEFRRGEFLVSRERASELVVALANALKEQLEHGGS